MKYLLILSALFPFSALALGGEPLRLYCAGETNYGDNLKLEISLSGNCEGNEGGRPYFCKVGMKLLEEAYDLPRGDQATLFSLTPEGRFIFSNKFMLRFTRHGRLLDIMDKSIPLRDFHHFEADVSIGGGRTHGITRCETVALEN